MGWSPSEQRRREELEDKKQLRDAVAIFPGDIIIVKARGVKLTIRNAKRALQLHVSKGEIMFVLSSHDVGHVNVLYKSKQVPLWKGNIVNSMFMNQLSFVPGEKQSDR